MKYISNKKQKKIFTAIFGGLLCLLIAACAGQQTDMSKLCGEWESTGGKPDIRIAKDGGVLQADAVRPKGNDGKDGTGNLSDSRERRGVCSLTRAFILI